MQDFEDILEMFEDYKRDPRPMDQEPRNMKLAQVSRSEMDNFNTPDLDQGADSILKPGETLEDDYDVNFRRANAQGGRIPFAKAGLADPANNVEKGQDLGRGVQQRDRNGKIKYSLSSFGSKEFMKKNKIGSPSFNNPEEALTRRAKLVKKFGDPQNVKNYRGNKNYKKLIEKNPKFKDFWKNEVDTNKTIKQVVDKNKLNKNNLEEIFNAVLEETRNTESIRKGYSTSRIGEKLISGRALENLIDKFEFSYLPNLGTIDTNEMGKLLGLSDGELSKLMANIDKPYPNSLLSDSPTVSRIDKANILKKKLAAAGIEYDRTNVNVSKGIDTKNEGGYRFKIDKDRIKELSNDSSFGFAEKQPPVTRRMTNIYSKESMNSDDYKKFGYSKDRGAIQNLRLAMNNGLNGMSDKELLKFINNNPKLKNLVTVEFDPSNPKMFTNKDLNKMDIGLVRQNVNMEVEHIRGKTTVAYDPATKKILDGLDLEYPKNLYIVPKSINAGTKVRVENYVAQNPSKKELTTINDYFKKNQITYFNRNTQNYGGYKPSASAVGLSQLGIESESELKKLITGTYVDRTGKKTFRTNDPDKFIATINEVHKARGGKPLTKGVLSYLNKVGKKGQLTATVLSSVLGYNFGEEFLKDSNIIDRTYQDTVSLGNAPIVEENFTTGEKVAGAGVASLVVPTVRKVASKAANLLTGPMGMGAITYAFRPEGGYDLKRTKDRLGFEAEAVLAPSLVEGVTSVTSKIKNPLVQKIAQTLAGVRIPGLMNPANALRIARAANPVGIALLAGEGLYHLGKEGVAEKRKLNAMTDQEREDYMRSEIDPLMDEGGML